MDVVVQKTVQMVGETPHKMAIYYCEALHPHATKCCDVVQELILKMWVWSIGSCKALLPNHCC